MERLRAAVIQMTSSADVAANVARAAALVRSAAAAGATLVVLPEKWNVIDTDRRQVKRAEPLDGASLAAAASWARALRITLVAGSISERRDGDDLAANTCVVFGPDGAACAVYRKLHLFDVDVVTVAAAGHRLGLAICYDLRFPELFRQLSARGADILTLPAAFTAVTGRAHWEILVRARAIENQAFVLAAGQVGRHATGTDSYGHSMIVDPWGTVLAQIADDEGIAAADLDFATLRHVRRSLPALTHRRLPDASGITEVRK